MLKSPKLCARKKGSSFETIVENEINVTFNCKSKFYFFLERQIIFLTLFSCFHAIDGVEL